MTKTNKKYYNLKISDIDGKNRYLNYFGKVEGKIEKNCVYISKLFINNGFINIPYGEELIIANEVKIK